MQTLIKTLRFTAITTLLVNHALNQQLLAAEVNNADADETITVIGTKTTREINEVAATVTQISREQIDAMASTNIRDMLRYEPGISVEGNGRYGLSGFNIRGINGDRVLILLDGVPIADEFSFGPNLSARRDFVDIDLISHVDIVRGPASTLYGSDAIGGVVAFSSKSPKEILGDEENSKIRVKNGFDSQSNTFSTNVMYAGQHKNWQWLLNAGMRDGNETESHFKTSKDANGQEQVGSDRNSSDPQKNKSKSVLAKLIYEKKPAHTYTFTADYQDLDSNTQLLSEVGCISRGILTLNSTGDDEQTRSRVMLDYLFQPKDSHLKRLKVDVFSQQSDTIQNTHILRSNPQGASPSITDRQRNSEFKQDVVGLHAQFDHAFDFLGDHYLIYGMSWQQTDSSSIRNGSTINVETQASEREFSVFPARDFPLSTLTESAIFIQDEYQLLDGKIRLSPGLRFDSYRLKPSNDELFTHANPGVDIVSFDEDELSAKFGAIYKLNDALSLWAQYAEGFRIPPMDDINVGFTNFAGGYTSLANPNLLPESVSSSELGFRSTFKAFELSLSAYTNDYENFIESLAVRGFNPVTNLLEFQARNIDDVQIKGIDLQASWYIGESIAPLQDWVLHFSTSTQSSENTETGTELSTVLPSQSVLGIRYRDLDSDWHTELVVTHTEQAAEQESDSPDTSLFRAPSYTTVDVLAHYKLNDTIRINAGIYNLTDNKYWLASEVLGRETSENLNRFTAPGRNFSTNLIVSF
ncbi:TonB-dependent hemoglobin/transferrin/lactoferrin family receptor [Agaribacter flavus]|uniref:TonB-dependent hemoglobin/transferrin/lactoferrin family receptor n=1 Tax=Agaribacter flavus TaxID=1902781 RepID=A0ABV7FTQ4_9ALTE